MCDGYTLLILKDKMELCYTYVVQLAFFLLLHLIDTLPHIYINLSHSLTAM